MNISGLGIMYIYNTYLHNNLDCNDIDNIASYGIKTILLVRAIL